MPCRSWASTWRVLSEPRSVGEPTGPLVFGSFALASRLGRPASLIGMNGTVRDLPLEERPRERLLLRGAKSLSDSELVAILLRTGCRGSSALEVGRDLLVSCGGLLGLASRDLRALDQRGLGAAKLATLLAAVEIGRRVARAELPSRVPLSEPDAVARYLSMRYGCPDQEVMGALFLDARHRLLGESEHFRGTLSRAAVEPRPILKEGLLQGAAALLALPYPSKRRPESQCRRPGLYPSNVEGRRGGWYSAAGSPHSRVRQPLALSTAERGAVKGARPPFTRCVLGACPRIRTGE